MSVPCWKQPTATPPPSRSVSPWPCSTTNKEVRVPRHPSPDPKTPARAQLDLVHVVFIEELAGPRHRAACSVCPWSGVPWKAFRDAAAEAWSHEHRAERGDVRLVRPGVEANPSGH